MFLMLSFSISNGYISTLIMLSGIADDSLEEDEVDVRSFFPPLPLLELNTLLSIDRSQLLA